MDYTPMQKEAVEAPVSNILVTAAAGSGKTQVLTGRILDRIKNHGADISKMLIITFTNAAAAEMRERISKKLTEASALNPKSRRLKKQLSLCDTADISTIHSFCLKILRSYFYKIDLDPSFTMVNAYDQKIMMAESLSEAIDYFYDSKNSEFLEFVDLVCGSKNDNAAANMIDSVRKFSLSDPFPKTWLDRAKNIYANASEGNEPFSEILIEKVCSLVKEASNLLSEAIDIASDAEGLSIYYDHFSNELDGVNAALFSMKDWDSCYNALTDSPFKKCPILKKGFDTDLKDKCKALRDRAKKLFEEKAAVLIDMPYSKALQETRAMSKYVAVITDAAKKAIEIYDEKKASKNVLDFNDLEHLAIKILTEIKEDGSVVPSETAEEIKNCYDEIYVDEYQDTNDIQETIINMISSERSGKPNVFMVGDMKQSIYRFRMTNPEKLFGAKSETYKDISLKDKDDKYIKIPLAKNFRSRKEIIDAVNSVFDRLMTKNAGGVSYKGDERLIYGSDYYPKETKVTPAQLNVIVSDDSPRKEERLMRQADFLSKRILALMKSGITVYDKDMQCQRPLAYRDIVLLFRKPKSDASYFERSMKDYKIPVIFDADYNFFDSEEIRVLTSLLKIIDNPLQDIEMVSVLRSPIFNFNENELAHLALLNKPYLYDALCEAAYRKENPDKKALRFITILKKWRREASLSGVYDFISSLIAQTGYTSYVSSMSDSEIHLSNINLFLSFAAKSDSSSYKGLFNFLKYIDQLYSSGCADKEGSQSSDIDAVRIMSIHKSKGLEFPYVFLCVAENKIAPKDASGNLLLSRELGIGLNAYKKSRDIASLPLNKAISVTIKDDSVSEELRVLYVALTRAREHLEIIASVNLKKNDDSFSFPEICDSVSYTDVLSAGSYLDWILMARQKNSPIKYSKTECVGEEFIGDESKNITLPEPVKCRQDISDILNYSYPKKNLFMVKGKYSVSELKSGALFEDENTSYQFCFSGNSLARPSYLNSDKVFTSAQKGSIMHYVTAHLNICNEDVESQIDKMNLTEKERDAVDINALKALMSSNMVRRMKSSEGIYREIPFTFSKKLSEITEDSSDDSEILIQGIIDCFFIESDSLVLIDYKTDKNISEKEASERYSVQLNLYAEALTKKYSLPVKEKYLYLFDSGKFIGI